MIDALVLLRLRRFLLSISALLFVGTVVELWLTNHMETAVQLIPFALSGLGLACVVAVVLRPQRGLLLALRACMALVVLGSLFGIYEHVDGNLGFQRELYPNASTGKVIWGALSGASPLLAPGILALGATLALAATYYHPALAKTRKETQG